MPIDFTCPNCQHKTIVDDQYAGTSGECAKCRQMITIPINEANPFASPIHQAIQPDAHSFEHGLGARMLVPVDRSVLSIIAGYLGLFSLICFPAPFAIIVGILAIRDIKRSDGKKHGLGRAWFGVIMGSLVTLIALGLMIFGAIAG